jgi:hypothetical protein
MLMMMQDRQKARSIENEYRPTALSLPFYLTEISALPSNGQLARDYAILRSCESGSRDLGITDRPGWVRLGSSAMSAARPFFHLKAEAHPRSCYVDVPQAVDL